MPLHLHRADRADTLAVALGEVLRVPLADPFATEVVAVPTRGVERWLAQRLSGVLGAAPGRGDGICAGVDFPSPRRMVAEVVAAVLDEDPGSDPWRPRRLVWPLLAEIDACRGEPWAAMLWAYLGDRPAADPVWREVRHGRRWATARRLAGVFARYAEQRPAMVAAWDAGADTGPDGRPLGPDLAWQPALWRRLRARVGGPGPVDRLESAAVRLGDRSDAAALPARLSIFGPTRLESGQRRVLDALARHRDVHLWLPQPSAALWDRVAATVDADPAAATATPRRADPTAALPHHRLLGYLGRDARELQVGLLTGATVASDTHHAGAARPDTLLGRLQADLIADRAAGPPQTRPLLAADDRSVAVHAAYGPGRQVEVLREVLLGLLADRPDLEPRDIVVLCPDIERFAPLIAASFGLDTDTTAAEHPGHRLRVRLADRSLRQLNPMLAVLSRVLELATDRVTAAGLLDLAAQPPVARRFGFARDDLDRLADLVAQSGVRWGLDAASRAPYGLQDFGQNTWAAGLDRLLLGVAMDEEGQHVIGTALPLDDVDSSDVALVGRLAELVERLRLAIAGSTGRRPLAAWVQHARDIVAALTTATGTDAWQVTHAYAELARLADTDTGAETGTGTRDGPELSRHEFSALLADALRGRATRANFRTGTLTVCTMLPMRSVPHRVVCLLGVDDGVFPRRVSLDGDDILARDPWVGDHDPRSEDRQLLLDALLAAEDHLVVVYAGADDRTGEDRPAAVPVNELLDALDRTCRTADERPVRAHVVVRHPLQPYDPGNFAADRATGRRFSFDPGALRGARAAARPSVETPSPWTVGELSPPPLEGVDLRDLIRFFDHPARALLRQRALLPGGWTDEPPPEELPVALDGLDGWRVGSRLLEGRLAGVDPEVLAAVEWRRGELPPRRIGVEALDRVLGQVEEVVAAARPHLDGARHSVDVTVPLPGGGPVTGTLTDAYEDRLVAVTFSQLSAKHRLTAWIGLLAATAAVPDRSWQAVAVGRGGTSTLGPMAPTYAAQVLGDLVDLYRTGLRSVLPFSPRTSEVYAMHRDRGRSAAVFRDPLRKAWARDVDQTWERVLGGSDLALLQEAPSRTDEERGTLAEPSRFGTLARRVFHPLFRAEDLR